MPLRDSLMRVPLGRTQTAASRRNASTGHGRVTTDIAEALPLCLTADRQKSFPVPSLPLVGRRPNDTGPSQRARVGPVARGGKTDALSRWAEAMRRRQHERLNIGPAAESGRGARCLSPHHQSISIGGAVLVAGCADRSPSYIGGGPFSAFRSQAATKPM
jgi:hypothetical protein